MLARIDSLLGALIFLAIIMAVSWLQKKQQEQEQDHDTPPLPPRPRPRTPGQPSPGPRPAEPPRPLSWEEELKHLLEGTRPQPPPPPPPVITQNRMPTPSAPPALPPPRRAPAGPPAPAERNPVEVTFAALPGLSESDQAYQEASHLDLKVQHHLREVTQKRVGTTRVVHRAASREASGAVNLVRQRDSIRSAILASVILGPPRGLE
jgi:hypothetical protein